MPTIDLLRHGETTLHGFLNGRTDPPLSSDGWEQMRRQVDGRRWSTIITSPARRAAEAAAEIAKRSGVPLAPDACWWEMDYGDWDGKPFSELRADPQTSAALKRFTVTPEVVTPPNGESWAQFSSRIASGLRAVADGPAGDEDDTLIVCHAGVIRATLSVTCGLPLDMLWRLRIGYAARVRLSYGFDDDGEFWGEIVELVQS